MSAGELLQAAVAARLRATPGLAGAGVFDAPPARAAPPFLVVDDPALSDWSTKSWAGREGRIAVYAADDGERPVRLRSLLGRAEEAVLGMPGALGEGWRVVGLTMARRRVAKGAGARWAGSVEFQVRMWRES